jgi:hypothetical protein
MQGAVSISTNLMLIALIVILKSDLKNFSMPDAVFIAFLPRVIWLKSQAAILDLYNTFCS